MDWTFLKNQFVVASISAILSAISFKMHSRIAAGRIIEKGRILFRYLTFKFESKQQCEKEKKEQVVGLIKRVLD